MEESTAKAIDDFMRSPHNKRKSEVSPAREMSTPGASPILGSTKGASLASSKRISSNVSAASYKKTGVAISKCYEMLCGRCGKRFSSKPSYFLDRSQKSWFSRSPPTRLRASSLPSLMCSRTSTRHRVSPYQVLTAADHDYECPFCFYKAQIILHETLLVGDTNQFDY